MFGTEGVRNLVIYKELRKILLPDREQVTTNPVVNYVENWTVINGEPYTFVNTYSFEFPSKNDDLITREMKSLNDKLISHSDLLLWVINAATDFSDHYFSIQRYLEKKDKRYLIIFDNFDYRLRSEEEYLNDYYLQKLLKGKVPTYFLPVRGRLIAQNLLKMLTVELGFSKSEASSLALAQQSTKTALTKLTIFGPPNSGKSTLLNSLVQEERSVVSEVAGTTKEDVSTRWVRGDVDFQLKDTEGIIGKKRNDRELLRDCDIAWVIIDASLPITKQTLQIVNLASKCEKAVLIILNKIDLIDKYQLAAVEEEIRSRLKSFSFVPIIAISALKKKNFSSLLSVLDSAIQLSNLGLSKASIGRHFDKLLEKNPPSSIKGKNLKIYYAIHEPGFIHKFVIFVNNPALVHFSYERYIANYLRKNFQIDYLPIKLFFKKS